jgi:glycosyltransferase involved in cell wall biosynthesis
MASKNSSKLLAKLTVLMTVYNGETYLRETIDSILGQSFTNYKFLILDNASTDGSREIISSYNDSRIHLEELTQDIGQIGALNRGLDLIDTQYIARIDADDISLPHRFERQVTFMDAHPEIGISGTYAQAFEGSRQENWQWPCDHDDIRVHLMFDSCLAHPSVIMRTALLNQHKLRYNPDSGHSEDWELWQVAATHFNLANIPEVHLKYRLHAQNESKRIQHLLEKTTQRLDTQSLAPLHLNNHPLRPIHRAVSFLTYNAANRGPQFLDQVVQWFNELTMANHRYNVYNPDALHWFLQKRLFAVLHHNTIYRIPAMKVFFKEKIYKQVGLFQSGKFILKVFLSLLGLKTKS